MTPEKVSEIVSNYNTEIIDTSQTTNETTTNTTSDSEKTSEDNTNTT